MNFLSVDHCPIQLFTSQVGFLLVHKIREVVNSGGGPHLQVSQAL